MSLHHQSTEEFDRTPQHSAFLAASTTPYPVAVVRGFRRIFFDRILTRRGGYPLSVPERLVLSSSAAFALASLVFFVVAVGTLAVSSSIRVGTRVRRRRRRDRIPDASESASPVAPLAKISVPKRNLLFSTGCSGGSNATKREKEWRRRKRSERRCRAGGRRRRGGTSECPSPQLAVLSTASTDSSSSDPLFTDRSSADPSCVVSSSRSSPVAAASVHSDGGDGDFTEDAASWTNYPRRALHVATDFARNVPSPSPLTIAPESKATGMGGVDCQTHWFFPPPPSARVGLRTITDGAVCPVRNGVDRRGNDGDGGGAAPNIPSPSPLTADPESKATVTGGVDCQTHWFFPPPPSARVGLRTITDGAVCPVGNGVDRRGNDGDGGGASRSFWFSPAPPSATRGVALKVTPTPTPTLSRRRIFWSPDSPSLVSETDPTAARGLLFTGAKLSQGGDNNERDGNIINEQWRSPPAATKSSEGDVHLPPPPSTGGQTSPCPTTPKWDRRLFPPPPSGTSVRRERGGEISATVLTWNMGGANPPRAPESDGCGSSAVSTATGQPSRRDLFSTTCSVATGLSSSTYFPRDVNSLPDFNYAAEEATTAGRTAIEDDETDDEFDMKTYNTASASVYTGHGSHSGRARWLESVAQLRTALFDSDGEDGPPDDLIFLCAQEVETPGRRPRTNGHVGKRTRHFRSLATAVVGADYIPLAVRALGGTHAMLFVHRSRFHAVRFCSVAEVPCGVGNRWHNKGAVGVYLLMGCGVNDVASLLLVSAHLAAHSKNWSDRDDNYWRIATELTAKCPYTVRWLLDIKLRRASAAAGWAGSYPKRAGPSPDILGPTDREAGDAKNAPKRFTVDEGSKIKPHTDGEDTASIPVLMCRDNSRRTVMDDMDYVIFAGDLNYRIVNLGREYVEQTAEIIRSLRRLTIRSNADERSISGLDSRLIASSLLPNDQLIRTIGTGSAFPEFREGCITFLPTYKYDVGSDAYDTSSKRRVPSFTDRILYRTNRHEGMETNSITVRAYDSIDRCRQSDHRPVYSRLTLGIEGNAAGTLKTTSSTLNLAESDVNHTGSDVRVSGVDNVDEGKFWAMLLSPNLEMKRKGDVDSDDNCSVVTNYSQKLKKSCKKRRRGTTKPIPMAYDSAKSLGVVT